MPTATPHSDSAAASPPTVPALENGLDLLELIFANPQALTQKQIATLTQKPASTTFRLLTCLEQRGYLQRGEQDGCYRPTLKLYGLAQLEPAYQRFRDIATTPLRDLSVAIGESCHLSVLDDGRVRVLVNQPSPHTHSLNVLAGSQYSAAHTASGRLLLAHLPEDQCRAILDSRGDITSLNQAEQETLWHQLRQLRRKGWSISPSNLTPGVLDAHVYIPEVWLAGTGAVIAVGCLKKWSQKDQKQILMPAIQIAAEHIATIFQQSHGQPSPESPETSADV